MAHQGLYLLGWARSGEVRQPVTVGQLVKNGVLINRRDPHQQLDAGGPQSSQAAGGLRSQENHAASL